MAALQGSMWRRSAAAIAAVVLTAACTGQESADSGDPPSDRPSSDGGSLAVQIDACGLVTPLEVAEAVGTAVDPGTTRPPSGGGENQGFMTVCLWEESSGTTGRRLVSLLVWSWPPHSRGAVNYLEAFRKAAEEFEDLDPPTVIALGDEALWDGQGLHARKGDVSISVSVSAPGGDPPEAQAQSQALAAVVLDKL